MLGDPITRRALLEVLILALALGPLGVWVLLHRQAYAAESMSHGLLPGLVLAALAGVPLVVGAAGGAIVAAAAIALAARDERIGADLGVAVAVSTLFGLGALLALAPDAPPRLEELLFGDLLGISTADLLAAGCLALATGAALAAAHRPLALTAFDRDAAPSLGADHRALGDGAARPAGGRHGRRRARAGEPAARRADRRARRRGAAAHAPARARARHRRGPGRRRRDRRPRALLLRGPRRRRERRDVCCGCADSHSACNLRVRHAIM